MFEQRQFFLIWNHCFFTESEYNYYQTQHDQHQVDPYAGYSNDLNAGYTSAVSERQDFDMDVSITAFSSFLYEI